MTTAPLESLRNTTEFVDVCDRLLVHGHAVRFRAEGWSMYPAIRDGETVEVVAVAVSQIRRGDVLLCRLGSGPVAHRVLRIDRSPGIVSIVLRGDAAFANDCPVDETRLLGKVTSVTRGGRRMRLDTPAARLLGLLGARAWRAKRRLANLATNP